MPSRARSRPRFVLSRAVRTAGRHRFPGESDAHLWEESCAHARNRKSLMPTASSPDVRCPRSGREIVARAYLEACDRRAVRAWTPRPSDPRCASARRPLLACGFRWRTARPTSRALGRLAQRHCQPYQKACNRDAGRANPSCISILRLAAAPAATRSRNQTGRPSWSPLPTARTSVTR